MESLIVNLKRNKPHWGARKIRELLVRRLASDVRVPAISTIHASLDRHGLVICSGRRTTSAAWRKSKRGFSAERNTGATCGCRPLSTFCFC